MNDPLDDLHSYLTNQGYQNVFVDGFVALAPTESDTNKNQINIQSEPSTTNVEMGVRKINWGIYVKNKDKEVARNTSKSIRNLLLNLGGKLVPGSNTVFWHKIYIVTEPYFWGVSEQNENIYLTRYQAIINDKDINTIYN